MQAFDEHPRCKFLTVTRKGASFVNACIVRHLFADQEPLVEEINIGSEIIDIYKGMQIMITKNICKVLGIVNGECGVIDDFRHDNIIIRLRNGKLVFLHLNIDEDDDENDEYYPFAMSRVSCHNDYMLLEKVERRQVNPIDQ